MPTRRRKTKPVPLHHHAARHLKRWLVPHVHNDHRPHLIRLHGLAVMALLIVGLQATAIAAVRTTPAPKPQGHVGKPNVLSYATGSITPLELLDLTNQQRAANGLPALRLD